MKNKGQILDTIVIRVQSSPTGPVSPARTLSVITDITDELYSYIVYTEYKDDTLIGWKCQFCVSHTSTYNCLLSYDCVIDIVKLIQESYASAASTSHKYIIGYKQAPLPVLLSILEPLTNSLASAQHQHWPRLELDDLCQMCRLCIITLYNKGCYIHKSIVQKSFSNMVLMSIRKERYAPTFVSIEQLREHEDGHQQFQIEDPSSLDHTSALEDEEEYARMRSLVINELSPRQYDQMVREYRSKTTTQATVNKVKSLKKKFGGKNNV